MTEIDGNKRNVYTVTHPICFLRFLSLSPSLAVYQLRVRYQTLLPPCTAVRALHFHREKASALSSLVDSRRTVLTRIYQALWAVDVFREIQTKYRE